MARRIRVKYRKLFKHNVVGLAYTRKRLIEIDERLRGKQLLEILIHELMHVQNPDWPEEVVVEQSREMAEVLWDEGVRVIDNTTDYL